MFNKKGKSRASRPGTDPGAMSLMPGDPDPLAMLSSIPDRDNTGLVHSLPRKSSKKKRTVVPPTSAAMSMASGTQEPGAVTTARPSSFKKPKRVASTRPGGVSAAGDKPRTPTVARATSPSTSAAARATSPAAARATSPAAARATSPAATRTTSPSRANSAAAARFTSLVASPDEANPFEEAQKKLAQKTTRDVKPKRSVVSTTPGVMSVASGQSEEPTRAVTTAPPPKPASFKKPKRSVVATTPGVVSVASTQSEEPSDYSDPLARLNNIPTREELSRKPSKRDAKPKRAVAATTPGVVSVAAGANEPGPAIAPLSRKPSTGDKKPRRAVAATTPGVVSVAAVGSSQEPGSVTKSLLRKSSPGLNEPKRSVVATTADAAGLAVAASPKEPGAATAAMPKKPAATARDVKPKRSVVATTPGVVSVAAAQTEEPGVSAASVSKKPASMTRDVKPKRSVVATTPGVVSVAAAQPEEPGAAAPGSGTTSAAASVASAPRDVKPKRSVVATTPGVVSVAAAQPEEPGAAEPGSVTTGAAASVSSAASAPRDAKPKRSIVAAHPGAVAVADASGPEEPGMSRAQGQASRKDSSKVKKSDYGREKRMKGAAAGALAAGAAAGTGVAIAQAGKDGSKPGVTQATGAEAEAMDAAIRRKDPRASNRTKAPLVETTSASSIAQMHAKMDQMDREMGLEPIRDTDAAALGAAVSDLKKADLDKSKMDKLERDGMPYMEGDELAAMGAAVAEMNAGMTGAPDPEFGKLDGEYAGVPGEDDDFLARAVAIEEDEYDPFLMHAEEYDPDAKPPLYKNRRFRLYGILGVVTIIAVIVGVVVGVVTQDDPTLGPPTMAPTTMLEQTYRLQFSQVSEEVNTPGSTYDNAANWIMFEDPLQLEPDAPNLIQRYVMAVFYYKTTDNRRLSWNSCNPPGPGENDTCTYLNITIFEEVNDAIYVEQANEIRWLSNSSECNWVGVQCDEESSVRVFDLWAQNMTGTLPTDLASLPYLLSFSFQFNDFTGTLPYDTFKEMPHLIQVEMHYNQLTGTIPESFWDDANNLQAFNVGGNMLSGTISTLLGQMTNLKGLFLFENNFVGPMPLELTKLSNLEFMRMHRNDFTGTIPTEIGQFSILQEFWLGDNDFKGSIPSEVGNMQEMTDLRFNNMGLTGKIPEELYNLRFLELLFIYQNEFSGTFSTNVGKLALLTQLRMNTNKLTGTIPNTIVNLRSLRLLHMFFNLFDGPVPEVICQNVGPGKLEFLNADCGPEAAPVNECECCSSCCDRVVETCFIDI